MSVGLLSFTVNKELQMQKKKKLNSDLDEPAHPPQFMDYIIIDPMSLTYLDDSL